jgi:hypothetical protein
LFNSPETWLVLFFFATGYILVDYGLVQANAEITTWMLRQKEINAYKSRKEAQKDETVTRRKVATFQSKSIARIFVELNLCRHWFCLLLRQGS